MARDLTIRITADNSQAVTALGQTEQAITKTTAAAGDGKSSGLAGAMTNVSGAFGRAATSLLRFAGPASVGLAIQQFTSFGGTIQDTADKLGVSTDAIQRWTFAAEQNGSTLASVTSSALFLYRQLAEGDKSTVAGLEQLGLTLEQVRAMKPEKAFELIADRVGKMKNPIDQVSLGAALMGRGFADVLPAAQQGFAVLGDKAQELGLVMDQTAIKAAEDFGNSINQLKTGVMALIGSALGPFIPVLNALLQALLPVIQQLAALLNVVLTPLAWVLTKVAQGLEWLIKTCIDLFNPIRIVKEQWAIFLDFFARSKDAIVNTSKAIYEGVTYWLVDRFGETVRGVKGLIGAVDSFYKQLWSNVVGRSYVPDMIDEIARQFGRLPQVMVQPASQATTQTEDAFRVMLTNVSNQFTEWGNDLAGFITGKVPGILGQGMGAVASGLLSGVMNLFTGGLNQLVQMGVDLAWKGLKKLGSLIAGAFKGEGAKTNDLRDEWMSGLGGLDAAHGLIAGFGNDWTLFNAFEKAYFASTRDQLEHWIGIFEARLAALRAGAQIETRPPAGGGGNGGGGGGDRIPGGELFGFGGGQLAEPMLAGAGGVTLMAGASVIDRPIIHDQQEVGRLAAAVGNAIFQRANLARRAR